jgi:hypothetical protein
VRPLDGELLSCPQCGSASGFHITSVKVATKNGVVEIDSQGIRGQLGPSSEQVKAIELRGNRIYLEYNCEQGHCGYIVLQFCKGQVFIEHESLKKPANEDDIWRD